MIHVYFWLPHTPVWPDNLFISGSGLKSMNGIHLANRGTTSAAWSLGLDHFAVSDKGSPNALPPAQRIVHFLHCFPKFPSGVWSSPPLDHRWNSDATNTSTINNIPSLWDNSTWPLCDDISGLLGPVLLGTAPGQPSENPVPNLNISEFVAPQKKVGIEFGKPGRTSKIDNYIFTI